MANAQQLSSHQTLPNTDTTPLQGSFVAWLVCMSAAMFFFYEFIQMQMFGAISSDLMRDFGLSAKKLGSLSSTYLIADVAFLIPAGIILDRISVRKVILLAMGLCVLGTLGFAVAQGFWLAAFSHGISGIGNAFCFLCCIMLATRWFPGNKQALVIGVIVTLAMVGGYVAQSPLAYLAKTIGWRNALLWDTVLGVAIMGLIWLNVKDYPPELAHLAHEKEEAIGELGFGESLRRSLLNTQAWLYGLYTSLLNLPIMMITALWGGLYLTQIHGLTMIQATSISGMILVGTIVGAPLVGWISDTIGRRKLPMLIGGVLSLATILTILFTPSLSSSALYFLFFLLGLFTSTQVISYPAINESSEKAISSTSLSIASVIIMGGGALSQPFSGFLMDLFWDGTIVDNVQIYTESNFLMAFSIIPIGFVLGLIAVMYAKETNCEDIK